MRKSWRIHVLLIACLLIFSGCNVNSEVPGVVHRTASEQIPKVPEKLDRGEDGIPILNVHDVSTDSVLKMNIEEYIEGVVAGEMKNDWPVEALKAQAILARTFVLKFCDTKESQYDGVDISTDVSEAQAYAPENINDRVRQAVRETSGLVMNYDGEYPYAWFFAHAGGKTELPTVALDYSEKDPEYLFITASPDSEKAPADVKNWSATFSEKEILSACAELGLKLSRIESVEEGERGESGRLETLIINGNSISAPSFRIKIGANKLKSTLITDIDEENGAVSFTGTGYGHGVGMSQWGAYQLAEEGFTAEEIIRYYFKNISIANLW